MKIRKEIQDMLVTLTRIRRTLHKTPDIGYDTEKTMKLVKKEIPLLAAEDDGISGVFYLKGKSDTCIGFRCELDGLPILEKNRCDYASKNQMMHACGHDAHMAVMICTLLYFLSHPPLCSLVFIFQPAEESGGGANYMIQKGIFEKYHIQYLFAMHVFPNMKDKIGCRSGILMAQSCEIKITINGKSAHAAHPEKGIDSLKAMHTFLQWVYDLRDEIKPNLIHFGKIKSGDVCNVISSHSELEGTLRSFDEKQFYLIREMIQNTLANIDDEFHTQSQVDFSFGYESVDNDEFLTQKIKKIAQEDYIELEPMHLSEDFSFYKTKCPCVMYLCGLSSQHDLHSDCFDLNEKELLKGIEMNVQLIERFMILT